MLLFGVNVNRSTLASLALLVALLPALALSESRSINVVNLMPAFFSADSSTVSVDARVQRFKNTVLYPNAAVYNLGYFSLDDPHIAWYLSDLQAGLPNIHKTAALIERSLPTYEASFESAFPKFNPQTVSIYLMPSMGSFDGMTKEVNGKHGLLIGVDAFSRENLPVGIFLDHELFHIYHHETNPTFFATSSENDLYQYGLYRQVWAEGLATYVSQKLNPRSHSADILASSDLANLSAENTRKLACFVSKNLDSNESGYASLLFDESQHPKDLPSRGGYYVGYLVAQQLGKTRSLSDLADLRGEELHNDLVSGVQALCGS